MAYRRSRRFAQLRGEAESERGLIGARVALDQRNPEGREAELTVARTQNLSPDSTLRASNSDALHRQK